MDNKVFNLNIRDFLNFWELIFLQQDCGNDSARDLHPALTTYLSVMFKSQKETYYRPWCIHNALQHNKNPQSPNVIGARRVVDFLRECADVLEKELNKE